MKQRLVVASRGFQGLARVVERVQPGFVRRYRTRREAWRRISVRVDWTNMVPVNPQTGGVAGPSMLPRGTASVGAVLRDPMPYGTRSKRRKAGEDGGQTQGRIK